MEQLDHRHSASLSLPNPVGSDDAALTLFLGASHFANSPGSTIHRHVAHVFIPIPLW